MILTSGPEDRNHSIPSALVAFAGNVAKLATLVAFFAPSAGGRIFAGDVSRRERKMRILL